MPEENEQELLGEENEGLGEEEAQDDQLRVVASSMVSEWEYNRNSEQLIVFFQNGHEGSYSCTPDQWSEAKDASSPGRFMHENFLSAAN